MYTSGKPSKDIIQPRLNENQRKTVTHSEEKGYPKQNKCVEKKTGCGVVSCSYIHEQADKPVERRPCKNKDKIDIEKRIFI